MINVIEITYRYDDLIQGIRTCLHVGISLAGSATMVKVNFTLKRRGYELGASVICANFVHYNIR